MRVIVRVTNLVGSSWEAALTVMVSPTLQPPASVRTPAEEMLTVPVAEVLAVQSMVPLKPEVALQVAAANRAG